MEKLESIIVILFVVFSIISLFVNKMIRSRYIDIFQDGALLILKGTGYERLILKRFRKNTYCASIQRCQTHTKEVNIKAPEAVSTNLTNCINDYFVVYGIKNEKEIEIWETEYSKENQSKLIDFITEYNNEPLAKVPDF